jgi:hypothetical protein
MGEAYNPAVNAWFERVRDGVLAELGDDPALRAALTLDGADAKALLDLARDAAHGSGARHFAPLATFLAGRVVEQKGGSDPSELIGVLARAVRAAGAAGEDS